ncbi:hypothetical protein ACIP95_18635 [Micromonospora parva]|uniref:hypothetical protein n=1 Tax=Micromonospora parva TaxID=1464048 RepID=UPI0038052BF5
MAVVMLIRRNASSDARARDSCAKPITAFNNTTNAIAAGVSHSRLTSNDTAAATSRIMISRS